MKRRVLGIIVLVSTLAVCAFLVFFNFYRDKVTAEIFAHMPAQPQTVSATEVVAKDWTPGIMAIGTTQAANGVDLAVQVAGIVKDIRFRPNQHVNVGDLILQLDDAVEKADLIDAQASVSLESSALSRSKALASRGAGTQVANEQALAQLATARSQLARTQAIINQKALKAPFSGIIGIPRINLGEFLQPGTIIATLQDLSSMKVDFTVPEQMIDHIKVNQSVRFGLTETEFPIIGHIIGIDPKIDPQTRLVSVQAIFENNDAFSILPGRFVHVRIELAREPNIVTVPQTAIITSLYGNYVYVVQEEKKDEQSQLIAKQVFVKVGRREGTESEIISGLMPGQKIVTAGQNKLQPGAVIKINNNIDVTAAGR
ncbi:MAG: efflux RND transporter periplasmic adaptor subunit [Alphaproteobacteria bacterium]